MSAAAWVQQLVLLVVLLGVSLPPARFLHGEGVRRSDRLPATASSSRSSGSSTASAASIPSVNSAGPCTRSRCSRSASVGLVMLYAMQRVQAVPAVQPDRRAGGPRGALVQHRGELRHQHELAELLPRDDGEPPHPDGRPHRAELRVGGRRHGRDGGPHPRPHPRRVGHDRQLLGRPHPHDTAHPPAASRSSVALVSRGAGRGPEPQRLRRS